MKHLTAHPCQLQKRQNFCWKKISLLLFPNTGQQVFKYLILLNNVKLIFEIIPMIFYFFFACLLCRSVAIIKSNKDTRYGLDSIVTHDGAKLPCLALPDLSSFRQKFGLDAYDKVFQCHPLFCKCALLTYCIKLS